MATQTTNQLMKKTKSELVALIKQMHEASAEVLDELSRLEEIVDGRGESLAQAKRDCTNYARLASRAEGKLRKCRLASVFYLTAGLLVGGLLTTTFLYL